MLGVRRETFWLKLRQDPRHQNRLDQVVGIYLMKSYGWIAGGDGRDKICVAAYL
jgi:hypothetical protein